MTKTDIESLHIQLYGTSPAPSRDYHGLTITSHHIILNTWHIAHSPYVFPRVKKCDLADYSTESILHTDIISIFGNHLHNYLIQLATGQPSLISIPNKLMLKILRMLSAQDILHLSQTSKIFWELCNTNPVWKIIFNKRKNFSLSRDDYQKGETVGWKSVLRSKLENSITHSFLDIKSTNKAKFYRPFDIQTSPTVKTSILMKPNVTNSILKLTPVNVESQHKHKSLKINKNDHSVSTSNNKLFNKRQTITTQNTSQSSSTSKLVASEKRFNPILLSRSSILLKQTSTKNNFGSSL